MSTAAPSPAPGVIARNVGGEIVLVPTQLGIADFDNVYLLSKVGAFLWQQLDGARDREALCALVRQKYRVPDERDVGADVDAFLTALATRKLLRAAP